MQARVAYSTDQFTIAFNKKSNLIHTILTPVEIKFHCTKLYDVFVKYMNNSHLPARPKPLSLGSEYVKLFDKENQTIILNLYPKSEEHYIPENETHYIIGKFLLETNLDWPKEYIEQLGSSYKPQYKMIDGDWVRWNMVDKGLNSVHICNAAYWGVAEISTDVMEMMNAYVYAPKEIGIYSSNSKFCVFSSSHDDASNLMQAETEIKPVQNESHDGKCTMM